jgi:hypothetical protein
MEKTTENETKTEFEEVKNDDSVKLEDTNAEDGETQKKKKKKRKKKKGFHFSLFVYRSSDTCDNSDKFI